MTDYWDSRWIGKLQRESGDLGKQKNETPQRIYID